MHFKEGLRLVRKNKFSSIVIIIQLTVAFLTLILSFILISDTLKTLTDFDKVFNEDATISISQKVTFIINDHDDETTEKLNYYYEKLSQDENIDKFGVTAFGRANYDDLTDLEFISNGDKKGLTDLIYMDENFYEYFNNIKLTKGRGFNDLDFEVKDGDIIPIIISKDLEKYIKFGEVYLGKYEVIGVISDNNKLYYSGSGTTYGGITQKKNTIIQSMNNKNLSNRRQMGFAIIQETMITLKDKSLVDEYITKIEEDLKNITAIPLKVERVSNYKDEYINTIKWGIITTLSISSMLLIFSFFGIMGIILTSIIRRKREFGIKLALGWTVKDICNQVVSEIFLLSIISFLFSSVISLLFVGGDRNFRVNIYTYVIALIVTLIFSGAYTLVPISKIKSMNIVDLIKDVK